jgi:hypothetical protein
MATDTPDDSLDEFAIDTSRRAAKIEAKQRSIERLSSARADTPSSEREAAAASEREVPPLPQHYFPDPRYGMSHEPAFTAGQMREYALAALSRAPQAVRVPLAETRAIATLIDSGVWDRLIAYAKPGVSMDWVLRDMLALVRAIEAAHGIVPLAPQDTTTTTTTHER